MRLCGDASPKSGGRTRRERIPDWVQSSVGVRSEFGFGFGSFNGTFVDDDGFGDAVVDAAVVGGGEVLEEAGAGFEHGGTVAKGAFDGLPQGDLPVGEGDDADAEEALAGRPAIGAPDDEAEVKDEPDEPCEVEGLLQVEFGLEVRGVIEVFAEVEAFFDEVLQAEVCGDVGDEDEQRIEGVGAQALLEGGQRRAGEGLGASCVVRMEGVLRIGVGEIAGHGNILEGLGNRDQGPGNREQGNEGWRPGAG